MAWVKSLSVIMLGTMDQLWVMTVLCRYDPESHATIFLIENFQTPGLQIMSKLTPRITVIYILNVLVCRTIRDMDSLKSAKPLAPRWLCDISK